MSYITLEVEIDHGRVVPRGADKLPERGSGLLTILEPGPKPVSTMTHLQAFQALQRSLNLDDAKVKAWMDVIRDARR